MRYRKNLNNDPRWIVAKFAGIDAKGVSFNAGEDVFYYPLSKSIYAGENARAAAADFNSAVSDEANSCW